MPHSTTYPGAYRSRPRRVFFSGTTALVEGQGVCYDRDYGTATSVDGIRDTRVEIPTTSSNRDFAGIVAKDYAANASGQWIEIYEPGSICRVSTLVATTVNSTFLTAIVGTGASGRWGSAAYMPSIGRGCAKALQTITANTTSPTDYTPCVFSSSLDGSATYTTSSLTVTKTGAFAGVPATANLQGNEYVYVVGGATTASSAAALTVGRYRIASKTSDDAVVLATAPGSADSKIAFYCARGNPTCLAYLCDGNESGLMEFVTLTTDGSGTTAHTTMVGGLTHLVCGATVSNGDAIESLADGTVPGQRKAWRLGGAVTTSDYVLSATSSNIAALTTDPADATLSFADITATVIGSVEFDADGDYFAVEWRGTRWIMLDKNGPAILS